MTLRGFLWFLFAVAILKSVGNIFIIGGSKEVYTIRITKATAARRLLISITYAAFLLWIQYNF